MQNLDKTNLSGLETQIDTLLRNLHQLRIENNSLQNRLSELEIDLQNSNKKNRYATEEITRIITQLKEAMQ